MEDNTIKAIVAKVIAELERRKSTPETPAQPNTPTETTPAVKTDSMPSQAQALTPEEHVQRRDDWITVSEAMELTGLNRSTICKYARDGQWNAVKIGRSWRVLIPDGFDASSIRRRRIMEQAKPAEVKAAQLLQADQLELAQAEPETLPANVRQLPDRALKTKRAIARKSERVERLVLPVLERRWNMSNVWLMSRFAERAGELGGLVNELERASNVNAIVKVRLYGQRELVPIAIQMDERNPRDNWKPSFRVVFNRGKTSSGRYQLERWFDADVCRQHKINPMSPQVLVVAGMIGDQVQYIRAARVVDLLLIALESINSSRFHNTDPGCAVTIRPGVRVSPLKYGDKSMFFIDCDLVGEFTGFDRSSQPQTRATF